MEERPPSQRFLRLQAEGHRSWWWLCWWLWSWLWLQWLLDSQGTMRQGNGFCSSNGNVEEPLSPWEGSVSPHPEVPGTAGRRMHRRVFRELYVLHPVCVLVVAVLVALVLALAVAVAVLSARTCGGDPAVPVAPVLDCPDDWVGYRNVCYYLSRDEGSWEWSQEQCSSRGASLAVLRREWEMEFLLHLKGNIDYWIGLRRWGERLEWVDGSSFNQTFVVHGQAECAYLYDGSFGSSDCSQLWPYICKKPQALSSSK